MVNALVFGAQTNTEVPRAEFNIASVDERICFAHGLALRGGKWILEELDFLEKDNYLICRPTFDVCWVRLEVLMN